MLSVYPARGCPYTCNFCSVIKIAGRQIRSTADTFNRYPEIRQFLEAMIEEKLRLRFFAQGDTQIARQEDSSSFARAGCFQMFVGVESFHHKALLSAGSTASPSYSSNIIGFSLRTPRTA